MGDKDPRDRHKTLATLQPSFVMPELDITHSSWLGKSFPLIDILRHNPALWPQSALSKAGFSHFIFVLCLEHDGVFLSRARKESLTCHSFRQMFTLLCASEKMLQKLYLKKIFFLSSLSYSNTSLRFSKSKHTPSDWVVTATARPHPHLHCIFPNLPAQKGTIKRPTKQMRFPYIRQPCNHISHVVSFPICYVLSKLEPECRRCSGRVTVQSLVRASLR